MKRLTPDEFVAATAVSPRTLSHWTRHGVLPSFRAADGTSGFTELHLLRVRGLFALQAQGVRGALRER